VTHPIAEPLNQPTPPDTTLTRRLPVRALALSCTAAMLTTCGTPTTVFEDRYAMRDGWHRATVSRTVSDEELPALLRPDCPDSRPRTGAAPGWVIVDYRPAGRARRAAVPVADTAAHAGGTPVYVQVQGCQRALAPRATPR